MHRNKPNNIRMCTCDTLRFVFSGNASSFVQWVQCSIRIGATRGYRTQISRNVEDRAGRRIDLRR